MTAKKVAKKVVKKKVATPVAEPEVELGVAEEAVITVRGAGMGGVRTFTQTEYDSWMKGK